jgi:multidrug efflux pump subunit AcrB
MTESRYQNEKGMIGWMASNPIAANLLLVIVLIAGVVAIKGIRKEVFPSFPTDTFTVTVPYPGSSPEEIEQGILLKIEEELRDIVGIKEIRSEAMEGVGVVTVEMEVGSDIAKALNQAKVRVDGIPAFPLDAEEPIVEEVISRGFAMRVSVYGDLDEVGLKQLAEQVREDILGLEGISEVRVLGDRDYEISIEVSSEALRRYGLDFDQVVNAIKSRSRDLPGGSMRTENGAIKLRSVSQAYTGEEFAALNLLTTADGTSVKLGEVATVIDGFEDQPVLSTLNGRRAITLIVDRVGNQDVLQITDELRTYIAAKQASLAEDVHVVGWIDESNILRGRIELMLRNAAQGAILVVLALALFLDLRLALWVIVGVPFAVMATLATIYFLGLPVSINVLSVFAFILVLGILVDDGIVTAESAYAYLQEEQQGLTSVLKGVRRVATATIFGALTTMIAFGPAMLLTEGFARVMTHIGPADRDEADFAGASAASEGRRTKVRGLAGRCGELSGAIFNCIEQFCRRPLPTITAVLFAPPLRHAGEFSRVAHRVTGTCAIGHGAICVLPQCALRPDLYFPGDAAGCIVAEDPRICAAH